MITQKRFELLIATRNSGKIREIQDALSTLPLKLHYVDEFPNISPVAETGETYRENAILKALGYSKQTGICALAEDSGLEVDALGGMPGVYSARFADAGASDQERVERLLLTLSQSPERKRTARFVCCMAVADWEQAGRSARTDAGVLRTTEGRCEGLIIKELRGANGFGFDPVFSPLGYDQTFGELPSEVKRAISHRAQAISAMREFFNLWLTPNLTVG